MDFLNQFLYLNFLNADFRSPLDYTRDLLMVASELKEEFSWKYNMVVTPAVVKLSKILDLEHAIILLTSFKFENRHHHKFKIRKSNVGDIRF